MKNKKPKNIKVFSGHGLNFTSFTDVLFNFLLVFIAIIILMKVKQDAEPSLPPNVSYQVVMDWPGESDTDMDLWAKDPTGNIVGFNNREGGENSLFSLGHDDLGARNDHYSGSNAGINPPPVLSGNVPGMIPNPLLPGVAPTPTVPPIPNKNVVQVNQEIISFRGMKEGEYAINGHCYAKKPGSLIDKVKCKLVKIKPFKEIKSVEREFKVNGDEITFFRFKVDKDGNVYEVNELPQKFVNLNKEADVEGMDTTNN